MANRRVVAVAMLAALAFVSLTLAVVLQAGSAPADPLVEFRTEDGRLTIPGGRFTRELQNLLFPPPPPTTYTVYAPERLGYPTINILGAEYDIPDALPYTRQSESAASWGRLLGRLAGWLELDRSAGYIRSLLSLDWFIGSARAVNRFAVFNDAECTGTAASTDADCWSTTSGGNGDGAPVSGDSLVLDTGVSPFTATGTMDANLSLGAQTVTLCSASGAPIAACGGNFTGTFAISTFSLTFTGALSFNDSGGTVSVSTGTINGGAATFTSAADLSITGAASITFDSMALNGGTYAKGTSTLTLDAGDLTMGGGDLTSTSGAVAITGLVNITSASSAIDFGSETWTITNATGNTWTNASTDATWDAGTGTVVFDAGASNTLTFAGANLSEAEFNNLTINSTATITYTMATRGLRWLTTLTVADTVSTVTLATADLALGATADIPDMTIGNGGVLTANASTVIANNLTMAGGTSGTITITTGAWTVSGGWDTSGAGSTFTQGTGTVTMTGEVQNREISMLAADNDFANLTITATVSVSMVSAVDVDSALTITAGTFGKATFALTAGSLTMSGGDLTSTSGNVTISGAVNISSASSAIDFGSETWTISGAFDCESTDTAVWDDGTAAVVFDSATGDSTFTPCNFTSEDHFNTVEFDSTATTAQTWTLVTRTLVTGSTLLVEDSGAEAVSNVLSTGLSIAITAGAVTIGTGGTLTANASTITVNGAWTSNSGTFTFGTSTIVAAASGTYTLAAGGRGTNSLYNLTVNASVTVTMASDLGVANVLTINGTLTGARDHYLNGSTADPVVLGGSASFGTTTNLVWALTANYNVPAFASYPRTLFESGNATARTVTIQGNITVTSAAFIAGSGSGSVTANATTATLTFQSTLTFGTGSLSGALTFTSGSMSVTSNVSIDTAGSYISWGSGSHTLSGTWTNATTSASWDAGTGTVTFNSATGGTLIFAGANLAEAEFNSVTFTSSAGTAQTFTMATRGLRWLTTLTVSDTSSTTALATTDLALGAAADTAAITVGNGGILTANASTVLVNGVTMTGGTSGTITVTTGAWTVSGNWDTSGAGSTYTQGTGIVTFDTTATITLLSTDNTFDDLTISGGTVTLATALVVTNALTISGGTFAKSTLAITSAGSLTMSGGDLTSTSGDVAITGAVNISSASSAIDFGSEAWTVSGSWTNSSTDSAAWEAGTGTVTLDNASAFTVTFAALGESEFNNLTLASTAAGSITFTMATNALTYGGTLTINSDTVLAKGTLALTGGALTVGGTGTNALTSTSGAVSVSTVNISNAASYIDLGSEVWTVTGTWTNATTSASWDAGTGTVTFNSATGGTVTFAGTNLSEAEFNSVTFNSSAGTAQTFTMATRALRWSGTLQIVDGTSTTALATANLGLSDGGLRIDGGGILTANASTVTVANVIMTFTSGGTLTLTTGSWTVTGQWDSSGATSVFTQGTSTVTFTATTTITMLAADDEFNALTINGAGITVTLSSQVSTDGALTITAGTLAKGTNSLASISSLTMDGGDLTSTSGAVVITGAVNISSAASAIDFGSEAWTVSGTWTNASTDGTIWEAGTGTVTFDSATGGTMTFAGTNLSEDEFNSVTFNSTGSTSQTFTMATRALRWGGTLTITDTSGGTILAKATLGLTGGALTISGTAASGLTSTSGAVTVTTVSVSTATAYIDLGSEAWTVSGSWTNSTTSASWDAGTGTVTFSSSTAQTMTFAGTNLSEVEFAGVTFNSTASTAITFTMATRALSWGGTLTVTDATSTTTLDAGSLDLDGDDTSAVLVEANGRLTFTTGNITDISDLDLRAGQMTMDGISGITDLDIETHDTDYTLAASNFDITFWTRYSVVAGGPDIQWTMDVTDGASTVFVEVEGLTPLTTFAIYRSNVEIQQAATDAAGLLRFAGGTMDAGWSPHAMIVNAPGLVFGGGGGGAPADPVIQWTWRHLADDLTVQLVVSSARGNQEYEWLVNGQSVGKGPAVEYTFPFSGDYAVTLRAVVSGWKVIEREQTVSARSLTFLGRYMPVLVPVLIALFFIALVITDHIKSDAGKLLAMLFSLGLFGVAAWLLGSGFRTFPLNSLFAAQVYAGMGILATAGTLRSRGVAVVLIVVGLVLLVWTYLAIIPSWV